MERVLYGNCKNKKETFNNFRGENGKNPETTERFVVKNPAINRKRAT